MVARRVEHTPQIWRKMGTLIVIPIDSKFEKMFGVSMGLGGCGGRQRIPWLLASFLNFEPAEHVPRTSARAHTCTAVFMRAPYVRRNREHDERPAGGRAKNADMQKRCTS